MTSHPTGTPPALMNNFLHNHVVHEQVVLPTIVMQETPNVDDDERVRVEHVKNGFVRLVAHYGFMESPDVVALRGKRCLPVIDPAGETGRNVLRKSALGS